MMTAGRAAGDTLLGFDFGTRRIGVALGSRRMAGARALAALECQDGPDWDAIGQLIEDWQPAALVVGLPLTLEGRPQPVTRAAQTFMLELERRFGLPVHGADERMSSLEAQSQLRAQRAGGLRRRRVRDADVDSTAAKLILEHWLSEHP
jgi:putative holliday junction resolvase